MDSNELQKFIDQQDFKEIGPDEIQIIIQNALERQPIKNLNMQYISEQNLHFIMISFRDGNGTKCRGAFQLDLGSVAQGICDSLDEIADQLIAIDQLNQIVRDQLYKNNNQFNVQYCWGSDEQCSIEDWQYSFIKIKLSRDSCERLRLLIKDRQEFVQNISEKTDFGTNAADTVIMFNDITLHQEIGAILWTSQVEQALTHNLIQVDDAIGIIKNNNFKTGKQNIKVVMPFNELGQFLVISDWEIDYAQKSIKQSILDQKILDIENRKYILDSAIYNRVEKRIHLQEDMITQLFQ